MTEEGESRRKWYRTGESAPSASETQEQLSAYACMRGWMWCCKTLDFALPSDNPPPHPFIWDRVQAYNILLLACNKETSRKDIHCTCRSYTRTRPLLWPKMLLSGAPIATRVPSPERETDLPDLSPTVSPSMSPPNGTHV